MIGDSPYVILDDEKNSEFIHLTKICWQEKMSNFLILA